MINEPYIQWAKTAFALMTLTDYNFLCINMLHFWKPREEIPNYSFFSDRFLEYFSVWLYSGLAVCFQFWP